MAAGWFFAVMIESSRTVESCLSFYHLCMKNNSLLQESFSKEPILGNRRRTPYIFKSHNEIKREHSSDVHQYL